MGGHGEDGRSQRSRDPSPRVIRTTELVRRGAAGTPGDGCRLLNAMGLDHTPPEDSGGGTDRRAELSKCNNHERQWFGGMGNKIKVLAMQAEGLKLNTNASLDQINTLATKLEEVKQTYTTDWTAMAESMRAGGRSTALAQATTRWNTAHTQLVDAAQTVEVFRRSKLGTREKVGQASGSTPSTATPTIRTGPKNTPAATSQDQTKTTEEPDLMKQVRQEFQIMRDEFTNREKRLMQAHADALVDLKNNYDRTTDDQQEKMLEQQKEIDQLKQQLREAQNQGHQHHRRLGETARDRLYRSPSPRRRLNFADRADAMEDILGPLGELGLNRHREQNRHTQHHDHKPQLSSILGRFGAYAGQVHMPATDPYHTTMKDEEDDYYRDNFPPPFNEPPPRDANRITEFRKLEGLVPKFSGKEEEFLGWMSLYIPNIHRARCPVAWKATILNKGMDNNNPTVRSIVATSGATPEEYAETIHKLVRAFAHPQGVVAAKLRALEDIIIVKDGEFEIMEDWLIRLENLTLVQQKREACRPRFSEYNYTKITWPEWTNSSHRRI